MLKHKFDHLSVLANIKFNLREFGMISGQDAYDLQRPLDYRKRKKNEPTAVLTELGWAVSGSVETNSQHVSPVARCNYQSVAPSLPVKVINNKRWPKGSYHISSPTQNCRMFIGPARNRSADLQNSQGKHKRSATFRKENFPTKQIACQTAKPKSPLKLGKGTSSISGNSSSYTTSKWKNSVHICLY